MSNTYFNQKPHYKYTFNNTRDQRTIICFIITNRSTHHEEIQEVKVLTSGNDTTPKSKPTRKKPSEYI